MQRSFEFQHWLRGIHNGDFLYPCGFIAVFVLGRPGHCRCAKRIICRSIRCHRYRENILSSSLPYFNRSSNCCCLYRLILRHRERRLRRIHYRNLLNACSHIAILIHGRPGDLGCTQRIIGRGIARNTVFENICGCRQPNLHRSLYRRGFHRSILRHTQHRLGRIHYRDLLHLRGYIAILVGDGPGDFGCAQRIGFRGIINYRIFENICGCRQPDLHRSLYRRGFHHSILRHTQHRLGRVHYRDLLHLRGYIAILVGDGPGDSGCAQRIGFRGIINNRIFENICGCCQPNLHRSLHCGCFHCHVLRHTQYRLGGIYYCNLLHACGHIAVLIRGGPDNFCYT
ncbi:hypothetical protein D3C76_391890 [compost metagenome]